MRMRPVALDVGREITRRIHFVVVLTGMYKIIHVCRVRDMTRFGDLLERAVVVAAVALFSTAPAFSQSLTLTRTIDLPLVTGRIDHLDIDLDGNRLFIAALAAGSLEVIDLAAGQRIARFMPLSEPQGVAYVPARHRIVVASGGTGRVDAYESAPLAVAGIDHLDDADNVRLDARSERLVVGYGRALAILDPQTLAVIQRIELPGHPEAFELEPSGRRLFVNVPSAGQVVVVDRQSGTITSTWLVAGAAGNFPMALDAAAMFACWVENTANPSAIAALAVIAAARTERCDSCAAASIARAIASSRS